MGITYDTDDLNSLALVAWKEARGEGQEGMQAVMHVIVNRVGHPGFSSTIHNCIYGKNQFTSMSVPSDPEFSLEPGAMDSQYTYCVSIAPSVLGGTDVDVTNNAHYYADLKYTTSGWFFDVIVGNPVNHPQVAVIGRHTFFL